MKKKKLELSLCISSNYEKKSFYFFFLVLLEKFTLIRPYILTVVIEEQTKQIFPIRFFAAQSFLLLKNAIG